MKKAIAGQTVVFSFDGLDSVTFDAGKAGAANRAYAEMHGWQARIGDMAAISRTQKDGSVITVTEGMRRDAILEGVAHYEAGGAVWELRGTGTKAQNPTWLAIAQKRGVAYDVVAAEKAAADLAELAGM